VMMKMKIMTAGYTLMTTSSMPDGCFKVFSWPTLRAGPQKKLLKARLAALGPI